MRRQLPPKGAAFVAWKKGHTIDNKKSVIIKLLVPGRADRVGDPSKKIRVSEAKVLKITDVSGRQRYSQAYNWYRYPMLSHRNLTYRRGRIARPKNGFCFDPRQECAAGIHCFLRRRAAVEY